MTQNGTQENTTPPSFDELAEQGGGFLNAKDYQEGKKLSVKVNSLIEVSKGKFGWRAIYNADVVVDKETVKGKQYSVPASTIKVLRDEYNIKDYAGLVGKTVHLLVAKGSTSMQFKVFDVK